MNKKQINFLFPALIGVGVAGAITGISLGIVELVKRQNENKNRDNNYVWLEAQTIYGVPIKENIVSGGQSFFGKDTNNDGIAEGMAMLKTFIDTRLHDGPEWSALQSITFGPGRDGWFIDNSAYGVYYPETRELFINTLPLTEDFPISVDEPNTYLDERMELMFQTLFHEYGHHIANMHLVKTEHDKTATDNSIYTRSGSSTRIVEPWSKQFTADFKSALNYDKNTPLYQSNDIKTKNGSSYTTWSNKTGYKAKSVGSVYDAQDLFNKSNSRITPSYLEVAQSNTPNNKYYYAFNPFETNWGPLTLDTQESINNLEYYYSMQELFTRKTLQLMFKYNDVGRLNGDGSYSPATSNGAYASSLIFDKLRYEDELLDSNGNTVKNTSMRYLHDGIFDQGYYLGTADTGSEDKLFDSYLKTTGAYSLDNITTVWQENPAHVLSGTSISSIPSNNIYQLMRSIKFGGFYEEDKSYTHIGYYDSNNNFVGLPIISRPYTVGRKNKVISNNWTATKNAMQYSLKDFVDVSTLDDRPLYFANQVEGQTNFEDITAMTSAKDDVNGYGDTATKLYYNPREYLGKGADSYFKAHNTTEGGVVISNLTSVNFFASEVEEEKWVRTKIVKL